MRSKFIFFYGVIGETGLMLLLLAFVVQLKAQEQLRFKHLTINEGLTQNSVFSVFQDRKGFIWIGTEDGLNRFDGYEFKIYKNELNNPHSLQHNQVNVVFEDCNNNLLIGTANGLSIFNRATESFTNLNTYSANKVSLPPVDFITSLTQDANGNIWVGTYDGFKLFDTRKRRFTRFTVGSEIAGPGRNKVQTIFRDNKNILWISVGDRLVRFDPVSRKFLPLPFVLINSVLSGSPVRVIRQDNQQNLWFGTERSGLFLYRARQNSLTNFIHIPGDPNSLPINAVRDIYLEQDRVWLGTRKGLSILNLKSGKFANYTYERENSSSLTHRSILSLMRDRAGNTWIGTFAGGVNVYSPVNNNFSTIGEHTGSVPGLNNPIVSFVIPQSDDKLWVGTEGGGLNYIDRKRAVFSQYRFKTSEKELSDNIIKCLATAPDGNLWVGTFDGLYSFSREKESFTAIDIKKDREFPGRSQVYALLSDANGLWAGTNGGGLLYIESDKQTKVYVNIPANPGSLSGNNVTSLIKDPSGNIWVGTERGLNYFDKSKDRFHQYLNQPGNKYSISSNNVTTLFFDTFQRLWVGTRGGGLNLFDRKRNRFYAVTEKDGIANNVIRGINQDNEGNLWISSNKGLSKLALNTKATIPEETVHSILNYTVADGLQSNQFLTNATARNASGELFFGGIKGLTTFQPEKMVHDRLKPKVVFTDFLINNKPTAIGTPESPLEKTIDEKRHIVLKYDQAYITFKYAALNFINAEKNQYAFKLEGLRGADDWHYVGNQRTATFTNLNAGNYIFKVKAANSDGIWSDQVAAVYIKVLPPWYKTWWAYLIYAIVIAGLLYLYYYFSYQTARLKNQLVFEHLSHEKDQELAQRKMAFFTNISHEIKTPLTLILAPLEKLLNLNQGNNRMQNQLMLMQRNGERLLRLINQLLDFRKFESGNIELQASEKNIISFMREVLIAFESSAKHKQIKVQMSATSKVIPVWFDEDKLEKVMYNLLSNALKFTGYGGRIQINIETRKDSGPQSKEFVQIEVEDNGEGIEEKNLPSIFDQFKHFDSKGANPEGTGIGLSFSKGLVELHHGEIRAESRRSSDGANGYTKIIVLLPLGRDHLSEEEISNERASGNELGSFINQAELPVVLKKNELKKQEILKDFEAGQKPLMLLVEDNPEVLDFISAHFAENFQVFTASDGLQGLEEAVLKLPDIIISDVMMPLMNGIELCGKLKSDVRTSHIPVILLTARTPLIFKIEGIETGADDYITKPFNLSFLDVRVWNLLASRKKLRERYSREVTLQPLNTAITSPDEKFLEKVMKFIEDHLTMPSLSVEELGKEVGMSQATLYRKIKALTNQNTIEFIRGVRLNRAAQLLQQNKFNVNEVAYMTGFSNVDYFRKCFKEQYGHTPTEHAGAGKSRV